MNLTAWTRKDRRRMSAALTPWRGISMGRFRTPNAQAAHARPPRWPPPAARSREPRAHLRPVRKTGVRPTPPR